MIRTHNPLTVSLWLFPLLFALLVGCKTNQVAQQAIAETDAQTRARTGALSYEDGVHIKLDRQYLATDETTKQPVLVEGRPLVLSDRSEASWNWNGDTTKLAGAEAQLLHTPGSGFVVRAAGVEGTRETGVNIAALAAGAAAQKTAAGEALANSIRAQWEGQVKLVEVLANGSVQVIDTIGRELVVTPTKAASKAVETWLENKPGE